MGDSFPVAPRHIDVPCLSPGTRCPYTVSVPCVFLLFNMCSLREAHNPASVILQISGPACFLQITTASAWFKLSKKLMNSNIKAFPVEEEKSQGGPHLVF